MRSRTVQDRDGRPLFEVPEGLEIDAGALRARLTRWVADRLTEAGTSRAVLGLSGGVDSALVAHLVAEAIGPEALLCVMLPYRTSSPESRTDAELVASGLGCPSEVVDISPMVDAYFERDPRAGRIRRGNFMARTRMAVLFDRSASWGGLVAGTGNKSEWLTGYTTLYGDSACGFNPVGDLYKTQVRQLAVAVGVPDTIVGKAPSADLWPGQTDESESRISYPVLDRILQLRVDEGRTVEEVAAAGFDRELVERIDRMVQGSAFKRTLPPVARLVRSRHAHLDHG